jgi:hypothetical protein
MTIISSKHNPFLGEAPPAGEATGRGSYCYMFPALANDDSHSILPTRTPGQTYQELAMLRQVMDSVGFNGSQKTILPAIYTYFGQFLNHDLTAPIGSMAPLPGDAHDKNVQDNLDLITSRPELLEIYRQSRVPDTSSILTAIKNQHSKPLTLQSLYGDGPFRDDQTIHPFYRANDPASFQIAETEDVAGLVGRNGAPVKRSPDLPRDPVAKLAKIFDQRNDENLITSQLHLAFMLFHNNAVAALKKADGGGRERSLAETRKLFDEARRLVTRHYQWCIANDYLEHVLAPGSLAKIRNRLPPGRKVPMEFTVAAFRFGHSMVSDSYDYNEFFGENGIKKNSADLNAMFLLTSSRGMTDGKKQTRQLPSHWVADWTRLARTPAPPAAATDKIDMVVSESMMRLGTPMNDIKEAAGFRSISALNIFRGFHRRIPSGQALAKELETKVLTPEQIREAFNQIHASAYATLKNSGFDTQTPAWVYFLCEASVLGGGNCLGPTASAIVAETIIGLLNQDPESAFRAAAGKWNPKDHSALRTPAGHPVDSIQNFLRFAGVMP